MVYVAAVHNDVFALVSLYANGAVGANLAVSYRYIVTVIKCDAGGYDSAYDLVMHARKRNGSRGGIHYPGPWACTGYNACIQCIGADRYGTAAAGIPGIAWLPCCRVGI